VYKEVKMDRNDVLAKIAEVLDIEGDIDAGVKLAELDSWDSLAKLSLMIMLEEDFAKSIDTEEIRSFVTVQDILDVIES
jgi:acyl carrier protein